MYEVERLYLVHINLVFFVVSSCRHCRCCIVSVTYVYAICQCDVMTVANVNKDSSIRGAVRVVFDGSVGRASS